MNGLAPSPVIALQPATGDRVVHFMARFITFHQTRNLRQQPKIGEAKISYLSDTCYRHGREKKWGIMLTNVVGQGPRLVFLYIFIVE